MKRLVAYFLRPIDPREIGGCFSCGYDTAGLRAPVCPECGVALSGWKWWTAGPFVWTFTLGFAAPTLVSVTLLALPTSAHGFAMPGESFPGWPTSAAWVIGATAITFIPLPMVVSWVMVIGMSRIARRMTRAARKALYRALLVPMFTVMVVSGLAPMAAFRLWFTIALGGSNP